MWVTKTDDGLVDLISDILVGVQALFGEGTATTITTTTQLISFRVHQLAPTRSHCWTSPVSPSRFWALARVAASNVSLKCIPSDPDAPSPCWSVSGVPLSTIPAPAHFYLCKRGHNLVEEQLEKSLRCFTYLYKNMLPLCVEFSGYMSIPTGTESQLSESLTLTADMLVQGKLLLICRRIRVDYWTIFSWGSSTYLGIVHTIHRNIADLRQATSDLAVLC